MRHHAVFLKNWWQRFHIRLTSNLLYRAFKKKCVLHVGERLILARDPSVNSLLLASNLLRWEFIKEDKKVRKQEKRKEKKNSTKKAIKIKRKQGRKQDLDQESDRFLVFLIAFLVEFLFSSLFSFFLDRVLFSFFLFSYFLVFFFKFPPQQYQILGAPAWSKAVGIYICNGPRGRALFLNFLAYFAVRI